MVFISLQLMKNTGRDVPVAVPPVSKDHRKEGQAIGARLQQKGVQYYESCVLTVRLL